METDLQVKELVKKYVEETGIPATADEVYNSITIMYPLIDDKDGVLSGFFGYDVAPSELFEIVAVLRLVYIIPAKRRSFKRVMLTILQFFQKEGYKAIEMHATGKVNNWFKKHLASRPNNYIHFGSVDDYIRRLT